ncbi:MAG: hypothetical protein EZS28_044080, partial [Streblomastix strix]
GENPHARGWEKIVYYRKMGDIGHNGGNWVVGNQPFIFAQQNVAMELNMDSNPRTLTFFVNNEEQQNYVTNIPQVVRFWAYCWNLNTQFKINKFEYLSTPTAKHGENTHAYEYGTTWKKYCSIQ